MPPGSALGYREEVHHPALPEPEIATGTVSIAEDGTLVRDQQNPERQISEVGEMMLSTRAGPDGERTLYPVPDDARPILLALRSVLSGDAAAVLANFATELTAGQSGWRLTLRPHAEGSDASLVASGCGGELRAVEIIGGDGVRRRLLLAPGR